MVALAVQKCQRSHQRLPLSETVSVTGKGHSMFGVWYICAFRHPLGVWDMYPTGTGGLLSLYRSNTYICIHVVDAPQFGRHMESTFNSILWICHILLNPSRCGQT